MKLFYFSVLSLVILASTAIAQDIGREVRRAEKLLAEEKYDQSYSEYLRVAQENNNPLAQFSLALHHQNGWGRPVDPVQACQWYEKAAQAGELPVAADAVGRCLAQGIHREADIPAAIAYYEQAADMGHHYSLCHLGDLYIAGEGVDRDAKKGAALCRQSAEQGSLSAVMHLAALYQNEEGLQDPEQALHWYFQAASKGHTVAQFQVGVMLRDGEGVAADPIGARGWFEQAAGQGYVPAYYETAELYFKAPANPDTGLWYEQDLARLYLWLRAAEQAGTDIAQREQAQGMLKDVGKVMPKSWKADLDAKVNAHLRQYDSAAPASG